MSGHRTVSAFLAALGGLAVGFGGLVILEASTSDVDATGSVDVESTSTIPLVTDQPSTTTTATETGPPTPPSTTSTSTSTSTSTTTTTTTTTTPTTTTTSTTLPVQSGGPASEPATTFEADESCGVDDILGLVRDSLGGLIIGERPRLPSEPGCSLSGVETREYGEPPCPLPTERDPPTRAVLIIDGDGYLLVTCETNATPQTIDEGSP